MQFEVPGAPPVEHCDTILQGVLFLLGRPKACHLRLLLVVGGLTPRQAAMGAAQALAVCQHALGLGLCHILARDSCNSSLLQQHATPWV